MRAECIETSLSATANCSISKQNRSYVAHVLGGDAASLRLCACHLRTLHLSDKASLLVFMGSTSGSLTNPVLLHASSG